MFVAAVPLRIRCCRKSIEIADVLKTNGNTLILHDSCVDFDGRNASEFLLGIFFFLAPRCWIFIFEVSRGPCRNLCFVDFLFLRCPDVAAVDKIRGVQRSV